MKKKKITINKTPNYYIQLKAYAHTINHPTHLNNTSKYLDFYLLFLFFFFSYSCLLVYNSCQLGFLQLQHNTNDKTISIGEKKKNWYKKLVSFGSIYIFCCIGEGGQFEEHNTENNGMRTVEQRNIKK